MPPLCDYCLRIPSDVTMYIQQAHLALEHIFCAIVEREYFGSDVLKAHGEAAAPERLAHDGSHRSGRGTGNAAGDAADGIPKAMAPVAGRPFLEILLNQLERAGCARVAALGWVSASGDPGSLRRVVPWTCSWNT